MSADARTVLITGANGYLGQELCAGFHAAGWRIVTATRDGAAPEAGGEGIPWRLGQQIPARVLEHVDVIVHAACATLSGAGTAREARLDLVGAQRLIRQARRLRAKMRRPSFIFISSQSARADAANNYGRAKWAIEQQLNEAGEVILRPGLIFGGAPTGLHGTLKRIARIPIIPAPATQKAIHPVHVHDVARCCVTTANNASASAHAQTFCIGHRATTFTTFLRDFIERERRTSLVVPLPTTLFSMLAHLAVTVPIIPGVNGERINGLISQQPFHDATGAQSLGVALQPVAPRRRALIGEGALLMRYIGLKHAHKAIRLYVRAVEAFDTGEPLPSLRGKRRIWGLHLIERTPNQGGPLERRLAMACMLAEALPSGWPLFGRTREQSLALTILTLAPIAASEVLLRVLRQLSPRNPKRGGDVTNNTVRISHDGERRRFTG